MEALGARINNSSQISTMLFFFLSDCIHKSHSFTFPHISSKLKNKGGKKKFGKMHLIVLIIFFMFWGSCKGNIVKRLRISSKCFCWRNSLADSKKCQQKPTIATFLSAFLQTKRQVMYVHLTYRQNMRRRRRVFTCALPYICILWFRSLHDQCETAVC